MFKVIILADQKGLQDVLRHQFLLGKFEPQVLASSILDIAASGCDNKMREFLENEKLLPAQTPHLKFEFEVSIAQVERS